MNATGHFIARTDRRLEADVLMDVAASALDIASQSKVDAAVVNVSRSHSSDLNVRLGELETVESTDQKSLAVSVYLGQHRGVSTTSDLSRDAVTDAVRAAYSIAKYTAEDPYNGLPPTDRLLREPIDLQLHHPRAVDRDTAFELALRCENAARQADRRITNSEGASFGSAEVESVLGNSDGLLISEKKTLYSVGCCVVAQTDSGMQSDYWSSSAREFREVEPPEEVGLRTAQRALRRVDSRRLQTCSAPVLFEAPVAGDLLRSLISAISGAAQYRKSTFLLDSLGQEIFPKWVRIHEQPHLARGLGSSMADAEGVATQARDIVRDGILCGYVLDSYGARKLGMETTGNAGGVFNLTIDSGNRDFDALLKLMDRGLLVTELMGFGKNIVTGDYSMGARGLWIEGGAIQYPVEELTIAGNLRQMFADLVDIGIDVDTRRSLRTGSILIGNMSIAGT